MSSSDKEGKTDRQFVASLERGLRIMSAFQPDDRALGNQDLAERTGLPRPTVSRFTHTLRSLNYLAYHPDTGRYSLTPRVMEMGRAAFVATEIRDIACPVMETLAELGPFSVALGVPSGLNIRYLELRRRPEAIVLNLDAGALVPMLQTAIGRAYLASLTSIQRQDLLARLAENDPDLFAAQEGSVKAEIAACDKQGFACSFGGWWPELSAVATVIRFVDDGDPLLLSISGLSSVLTAERLKGEYAAALLNSAQVIESRMRRAFHR
ncbi:IclR family transcriptional regulator [Roseibium marinum]|uniref:DNA-binding IclR family transcriptional regulator n=1 Tax=Roseibium marinum TaxID=281252 RepID=A0A2S3V1P9_9HYPH|nr:IclR family transcriptional regulator [Roseibium marinum]POF33901.1 DNA-binding IclR family transcriptional regulator [Roseibium marinum]